jgi:hypothetical protein
VRGAVAHGVAVPFDVAAKAGRVLCPIALLAKPATRGESDRMVEAMSCDVTTFGSGATIQDAPTVRLSGCPAVRLSGCPAVRLSNTLSVAKPRRSAVLRA